MLGMYTAGSVELDAVSLAFETPLAVETRAPDALSFMIASNSGSFPPEIVVCFSGLVGFAMQLVLLAIHMYANSRRMRSS